MNLRRLPAIALPLFCAAVGAGIELVANRSPFQGTLDWGQRYRGSWIAVRDDEPWTSATTADELRLMRGLGIDWIACSAQIDMPDVDRPILHASGDAEATREKIRLLKSHGFHIFFLPRIESPAFYRAKEPAWRGDIKMKSADDWAVFHDRLEEEIVRYAVLAEEEGVELFGLGLEYHHSAGKFADRWRRIAESVRAVFRGKITYSANWWKEYEEVRFWDAVDYIGVGSYFPLCDSAKSGPDEWRDGWEEIREKLENLAIKWRRPIVFTEIGYPTYRDAAYRPWEWTSTEGKVIDPAAQAACYRLMFDELAEHPWFHGMFLWRFYTKRSTIKPWDYSPQNKPAEAIVREVWERYAPKK